MSMEFVKPELLVLVPVLYLLGAGMKKASFVRDGYIPLLLGGAGIALAVLWTLASSDISSYKDALQAVFTAVTQGVLCAGGSVYVNQAVKQAGKAKGGEAR